MGIALGKSVENVQCSEVVQYGVFGGMELAGIAPAWPASIVSVDDLRVARGERHERERTA